MITLEGATCCCCCCSGCPQKPKDSNTAQAQHRKDSPHPHPRLSIWIELASELALNVDSSVSTVNKNFQSTGRSSKVWIVTGKEATENLLSQLRQGNLAEILLMNSLHYSEIAAGNLGHRTKGNQENDR